MELREYYALRKVITLETYDNMIHAIGLDNAKPKRGKYEAYRNYYVTNNREEETSVFDIVIREGLVARGGCSDVQVSFHVTQKGFEFIGIKENCKITEID
jgi:hypothetical protein